MGAVACRLEMNATRDGARLYIMTLGVYAAHRDGKDWIETARARARSAAGQRTSWRRLPARTDE